ncbi:FAD-dependent monooxygenase [Streptomyces mutabilis]|uniref:FAD-dependent monooxygenase n=1 Tax=Streptomyces mutabilis TaxID=67332 RepID=UPI00365BD250
MTPAPTPRHRAPGEAVGGCYDVVVAGGGPAGAAAAITLARAGRSVLLADAGAGPPKTGESLVPAARLLLGDLGIDVRVLDADHRLCHANLSAWGSGRLHRLSFLDDPHGHGWHLHRPAFDRLLRRRARDQGAHVVENVTVTHPTAHPAGGWEVATRTGAATGTARCRWLIDATGRRAALAARYGARRVTYDRLIAVHLRLTPGETDAEEASLVEAVPDGWWHTAPHNPAHRLLTYFTDSDLVPAAPVAPRTLLDLLAATRHTAMRAQDRPPLPGAVPRRCAASTTRLHPVAGDHWIAAGDAAVTYDPLSSQGLLTALYSGLSAGRAVDAHLRGDPDALTSYATGLRDTFRAYAHAHREIHRSETRWPDHTFWQRRHTPSHPATALPDPEAARAPSPSREAAPNGQGPTR